jgi:hypothetical protein
MNNTDEIRNAIQEIRKGSGEITYVSGSKEEVDYFVNVSKQNKYQQLTNAAQKCYDTASRFQSIGERGKAIKWKRKGDVCKALALEVGLYEVC